MYGHALTLLNACPCGNLASVTTPDGPRCAACYLQEITTVRDPDPDQTARRLAHLVHVVHQVQGRRDFNDLDTVGTRLHRAALESV